LTFLLVTFFIVQAPTDGQGFDRELDPQGRWINGVTEPWWFQDNIRAEDIKSAQSVWTSIGSNNGTNDWTGDYFVGGDTHGSYLRWMPQGYVLFHVDKCQAKVMGLSYGKVIYRDDLVQLLPEKASTEGAKHGHRVESPLRFLPVTWRNGRYLVAEDEIAEFGDYVAGLGKYNSNGFPWLEYAQFFYKPRDSHAGPTENHATIRQSSRPIFEVPLVPSGYEKFIKKPIDGNIVARAKGYVRKNAENEWWDDVIIPVSINVGSANGLKEKMVLRVVGTEGFGGNVEYVEITKLNLKSSRGIITRPVRKTPCIKFAPTDDCANPDYLAIKVGLRVTTNPVREDDVSNN
jgi:hypothetical protein